MAVRSPEKEDGIAYACCEPETIPETDTEHTQNSESKIRHRHLELKWAARRPPDRGGHLVGKECMSIKNQQAGKTDIDKENIEENDFENLQC